MSAPKYMSLLSEGKLQFIFNKVSMDIRYHDPMLFTVDGDAMFPTRLTPMSFWHLRGFFAKYANADRSIYQLHPLHYIHIKTDESESSSLAAIDNEHYPKSVEPVDEEVVAWRIHQKERQLQRKQQELLEKQQRREKKFALRELIRLERAELKAKDLIRTPASRRERLWLYSPLYDMKFMPVILDVKGETVILKSNYLFDWNGQKDLRLYQMMYRIARSKGIELDTDWDSILSSLCMTKGENKGRNLYAIEVGSH